MKKYTLEVSSGATQLQQAVEDAADGEVVFLSRSNRVIAAVVPPEVAAAGMAALDAADQIADLKTGKELAENLEEEKNLIKLADLRSELG